MQSIAPSSPAEIREKILARQKSRRENLHHNETKQETSGVNSAKSSDMVLEANICEKEAVLWGSRKGYIFLISICFTLSPTI